MEKKKRSVSHTPAPIRPVSSVGYWVPSPPQPLPIRLLSIEWLKRFPNELIDRIEFVVGEAFRRFETQDRLLPFLKRVIARLTPDFRRMGAVYPATTRMGELVEELLYWNTRDPEEKRRLFDEIRKSPEWRTLAKTPEDQEVAKIATAQPQPPVSIEPAIIQSETREQRAARRQKVVMPILEKLNWTASKWASKAGVGKSCAYEYLNGTREKIKKTTRNDLAEALELTPEQLPA